MWIIEYYDTNKDAIFSLIVEGQLELHKGIGILNKHNHEILTINER